MLNLTIGSYTAMKCSFYQNVDGELCCKTVKVDGKFKSGVKIKARFHDKSSLTTMVQKIVSLKLNSPLGGPTVKIEYFIFERVNFYES